MRSILPGVIGAFLLAACQAPRVDVTEEGRSVLVIVNGNSRDSLKLGAAYRKARGVPLDNVVVVTTDTAEEIPRATFDRDILPFVRAALKNRPKVKYLLLTKGMPLRVTERKYSVDALLGAMDVKEEPTEIPPPVGTVYFAPNPYFGKNEPFSPAKYGFRIACRIDGYTLSDAMGLIERGKAVETARGPFLLDRSQSKGPVYDDLNEAMTEAAAKLRDVGAVPALDSEPEMVKPSEPVAAYCTWGSNDPGWNEPAYHSVMFRPGAIAETFVSTSARTFTPTTGGQSMIADLIRQGVTGVKGYVSEPFTFALCRPEILFPRYASGYTLGESFAMASPVLKWKDVILGDPLCRPYPKK